jgi:prepilin-type N-terminal cleavage/methylation domain-containing protein
MLGDKKSFTLIEMLISISLFGIIIVFLYDTLELSQKSNQFFTEKIELSQKEINIKKVLFNDIINASIINIFEDKNKNFIITMKSKNIYHKAFYNYITYIVSKKNNLLRIEHKHKYNKGKNSLRTDDKYIDIVLKDIEIFKVIKNTKEIIIAFKTKNKDTTYLLIKL